MNTAEWVLLDTETTGLAPPIYTVELAARRMRGWQTNGPPFRRLLNQNAEVPAAASRVHGYTREILARDGEPALTVYADFADYVQGLPLVAYNLQYDLEQVLVPEWARLGIAPIGVPGFCALRLAQRLLDPVPAGNCKLQTLRQFYRLPERGAHTALGDVNTVADLLQNVLRPLAEQRQLATWAQIVDYANEPWFPSRIAFGKFKGRLFQEALHDAALMSWLEWLATSTNPQSAELGRWYLAQLAQQSAAAAPGQHLARFEDPVVAELKRLVEAARLQLAEIESRVTAERHAVEVTQAALFALLREFYEQRDHLAQVVEYRQIFLHTLLREGEEAAEEVVTQFEDASQRAKQEYEDVAAAAAGRRMLGSEETAELQSLWKKLVRLYHPDRFVADPQKLRSYTALTSEINTARDAGNIALLREIANDPDGFMLKRGLSPLSFEEIDDRDRLQRLLDALQLEIAAIVEAEAQLHADPGYELHKLASARPDYLQEVADGLIEKLKQEIEKLAAQAAILQREIGELTDSAAPGG